MFDDQDNPQPETPPEIAVVEVNPVAEAFYSGALARITYLMPVLGVLGAIALWWRFGGAFAAGFVAGGIIACVNFYWLKRVVNALGAVSDQDRRGVGRAAVIRFLLRYGVILVAAYAILNISERGLYGMFTGLFLPVAAIGCEAIYELNVALRRGL